MKATSKVKKNALVTKLKTETKATSAIFDGTKRKDMAEGLTPSLLAALEQCKDMQMKLTSTIFTLEDHNDFLTDKCVQTAEQLNALKSEHAQQKDAVIHLSAENILLRQKVNALQQYQEKFEEIRKEVASLRRSNMQLESNQKSSQFQNIEVKYQCYYHGMVRLSDLQSDFLEKEQNKCLKTQALMNWITLIKNKNASVDLVKQVADRWQKKYEEHVSFSTAEAQKIASTRREFLAKCAELDAEKRNVHSLSNRVRQLASVIAGLQEQHNAEIEQVVTDLSRENIGLFASSHPESLSKVRSSLSPARSPESPMTLHEPLFTRSTAELLKSQTPRCRVVPAEKIEIATRECNEVFRQMAKRQASEVPTEDRRFRTLSSTSPTQNSDPKAVEIMVAVVLNVFAKWKLAFPFKKIGATCYEWKGKKWHLAVQSQILKARVGAGYEEFLPILCKEIIRNGP